MVTQNCVILGLSSHRYISLYIRFNYLKREFLVNIYSFSSHLPGSILRAYNKNKKFWEELIVYFPLILYEPHIKRRLQQFFVTIGTCLPSRCLATVVGHTDNPTDSPLIRHGPNLKRCIQQLFYCCTYSLPLKRVYRPVA
jgi:hypothetical protein